MVMLGSFSLVNGVYGGCNLYVIRVWKLCFHTVKSVFSPPYIIAILYGKHCFCIRKRGGEGKKAVKMRLVISCFAFPAVCREKSKCQRKGGFADTSESIDSYVTVIPCQRHIVRFRWK